MEMMTSTEEQDPESNLYEWEKAGDNVPEAVREEIIMFEKEREELQIRLADKDKALEEARVSLANLDVEMTTLKAEHKALKSAHSSKIIESKEYKDLLLASQQQEERIRQLEEIETKRVASRDFVPASNLQKEVWIAPEDGIRMFARLRAVIDNRVRGYLQLNESGRVLDIYPAEGRPKK